MTEEAAVEQPAKPPKPKRASRKSPNALRFIELPEAVNDFQFEGVFLLDPLDNWLKNPGSRLRCSFMLGHRVATPGAEHMGPPVAIRFSAFEDLGAFIVKEFKRGDYVLVRGRFSSWRSAFGYQWLNAAKGIERVSAEGLRIK